MGGSSESEWKSGKLDAQPKKEDSCQLSSWFGDFGNRQRTLSETDKPKVRYDLVAWLGGFSGNTSGNQQNWKSGLREDPTQSISSPTRSLEKANLTSPFEEQENPYF